MSRTDWQQALMPSQVRIRTGRDDPIFPSDLGDGDAGNYEAHVSQGPIAAHSAEHLRTSDRGVAMLRRALREQLAVVVAGGDPVGVGHDPARQLARLAECGNFAEKW